MGFESQVYLGEIETQIEFSERSYREFKDSIKAGDNKSIFYHAHHFLVHAINIDKLLDSTNSPQRNKAIAKYNLAEMVDLKPFRRLRNHLEHYETRLDRWLKKNTASNFFDRNIIVGAVNFPFESALRTLDNEVFVFQGERYDLDILFDQILKVKAKLPNLIDRWD